MSATSHYTPQYTQLPLAVPHSTGSVFSLLAGGILLIEGLWGTVSPMVFSVLSTNTLHAVIHIALGVAGLYAGARRRPSGYLLVLGTLLLVVGGLYFIPFTHDRLVDVLNLNTAVAVFNLALGSIALVARRMS